MLVETADVIKFLDANENEESKLITSIQESVEKWISSYCHRVFETTTYSKYYNGNGAEYLLLDYYPITALTRVAIGRRSAIRIKNTSDYTSATISVNSTGLVFTKDDTSDATVTFASNTTMSAVVTAINALGSGWSAVIESSDYTSFKSSELVEMFGRSAIDDNWVYLDMPNQAIDDFEVYPDSGEIYRANGWMSGHRNIFVKHTAGYTADTMPEDLKLAVKILCKYTYQKRNEETFGVGEYWVGDARIVLENGALPKEAIDILSKYKRILI